MERIIKSMENKYLLPSLGFVEDVFTKYKNSEEGKAVRQLVEEIRSKKYDQKVHDKSSRRSSSG